MDNSHVGFLTTCNNSSADTLLYTYGILQEYEQLQPKNGHVSKNSHRK